MTKMNPNNGNETNQTFFHGTYSNVTRYIYCCIVLKALREPLNMQTEIC